MNSGSWDRGASQASSKNPKDQLHMLCNRLLSHQQPQKKATIAFLLSIGSGASNNKPVGFWHWTTNKKPSEAPTFLTFFPLPTLLRSAVPK